MENRWTKLSICVLIMLMPMITNAKVQKLEKIDLKKVKPVCYSEARPYQIMSARDKEQLDRIIHKKFDPKIDPNLTLR